MMKFVMNTISFTVAILLASLVAFVVMLQPKVMKWYLKLVQERTMELMDDFAVDKEDEL